MIVNNLSSVMTQDGNGRESTYDLLITCPVLWPLRHNVTPDTQIVTAPCQFIFVNTNWISSFINTSRKTATSTWYRHLHWQNCKLCYLFSSKFAHLSYL